MTKKTAKKSTTTKVIQIKRQKQLVEERLASLYHRNGEKITPRMVVDDARNPDSPLHACFPWDDAKAADERRLEIARELIRGVPLLVQYEQVTLRAPKYIRDPKESSGYVEVAKLRTKKDAAREVVRAEADRANAALQRARAVASVLGLGDLLDELIVGVEDLSRRVS